MSDTQNSKTYSVALAGTGDFCVPIFDAIHADPRLAVAALITQPDKPAGRKKLLTPAPAKQWALPLNIRTMQPESLAEQAVYDELASISPDVMVVVAYGKMIPNRLIELPTFRAINVHPSLLPRHRGPSPMQYAIMKGDTETGISYMLIDDHMDHGPLLKQITYPLNGTETYQELSDTLAQMTANHIADVVYDYCEGKILPVEQNHEAATFTKLITTHDGLLFWEKPAVEIERRIRALNPEPGTYCHIGANRVKIRRVGIIDGEGKPGRFFAHEGSLAVYCGEDALMLEEVQPAGKPWMSGEAYLRGYGLPT